MVQNYHFTKNGGDRHNLNDAELGVLKYPIRPFTALLIQVSSHFLMLYILKQLEIYPLFHNICSLSSVISFLFRVWPSNLTSNRRWTFHSNDILPSHDNLV